MSENQTPLILEIVTDPSELAKAQSQDQCFARNSAWLQAHISDVYARHRGKCICVAGEELFVADTSAEAVALARASHANDDGRLIRFIPREKLERIYAH